MSHDRRFLDNVVTSTIVNEAPGVWREYEGSVEDWLLQSERARALQAAATRRGGSAPAPAAASALPSAPVAAPPPKRAKLSFKEQREFDDLPARIEALEAEQRALAERLADASLYTGPPQQVAALQSRAAQVENELLASMERWETLGSR